MAKPEEQIFKKAYTDFDERLDRELEEEKEARRRELLLQAPDYKLMNYLAENGSEEETPELARRLKDAGIYYLRSQDDSETEKFTGVFRKSLLRHPGLREDMLKSAGLVGCFAFKQDLPKLGKSCGEMILEDLRLLGNDSPEVSSEGFLYLKNVADTAARSRSSGEFRDLIQALQAYWNGNPLPVTPGLLALLADILFVAADRRQNDVLIAVCRLSRAVLLHPSVDRAMRLRFVTEWAGTAAQIAQRGWEPECRVLLGDLCRFLSSARDMLLAKKVLADISVQMQMQTKWDGFASAFRLYYPCQMFALGALRWALRRYRKISAATDATEDLGIQNPAEEPAALQAAAERVDAPEGEGPVSRRNAADATWMMAQMEKRLELLSDQESAQDMISFLLRNVRDTAAACARLEMKDEWEIYGTWQQEWLAACARTEKRRNQVRLFMQLAAEYWHSTQPARSNKQWENMAEIVTPSLLKAAHRDLLEKIT